MKVPRFINSPGAASLLLLISPIKNPETSLMTKEIVKINLGKKNIRKIPKAV